MLNFSKRGEKSLKGSILRSGQSGEYTLKKKLSKSVKTTENCFEKKSVGLDTLSLFSKAETDIGGHLLTLFALSYGIGAKVVFEIGVRDGESTVSFLQAVKKTGGVVISLDINPCEKARKRISKLRLEDYWIFVRENSNDYVSKYAGWPVDVLFIDGEHTRKQCEKDFNNYVPFVKRNGLIIFHDAYNYKWPEINEYLNDLRLEKAEELELVRLPYNSGLGIARKIN